jgi:DNA-3-methyladenine glycosylase II
LGRSLTRSIVYQQIHGKAAASIYDRFLKLFIEEQDPLNTNWFPTPDQVLAKSVEELRSAGLSGRKVEYIQNLASKFKDKSITPEHFNTMTDEEISAQLCAVKGIGQVR